MKEIIDTLSGWFSRFGVYELEGDLEMGEQCTEEEFKGRMKGRKYKLKLRETL